MSGFENDVMVAKNVNFDNTGAKPHLGIINTNGQLLIGNASAPFLRAGILDSPDTSIAIGYSAPNITLTIAGGATVVKTISGDTGTATPSSGNITLNANTNSGKTVLFNGSGSTVSLKVTDASRNTIIGLNSGSNNMGTDNVGLGELSLASLNLTVANASGNTCVGRASGNKITTGQSSTCIGQQSGNGHTTGTGNTFVGSATGTNYTSSESSNILIGANVSGTVGESNVCRIGTSAGGTGQITSCFIAGIAGVTSVSSAVVAGLATGTGQLVQSTITAGTGITVTPSAGVITIANTGASGGGLVWTNVTGTSQTVAAGNGYLSNNAGTVAFALPASGTIGDVFRIVGVQGAWTLSQAAGQQIKFGSGATTVGVTGSVASNNAGDCIELVATNTSASTVWRVMSSIGTMTLA